MKRIDTASRVADLFGVGKDGFRDGNLALGLAATAFNAQWSNGIQEEIVRVIEAAGLVPTGADFTQLLQAMRLMTLAKHGQCRLTQDGSTQLSLQSCDGDGLVIDGQVQRIPAAGVTQSNAGLAASTLYRVYAYWAGSAIALGYTTLGQTKNTANGVMCITGHPEWTLVGMLYTDASAQFQGTHFLTWFNRKLKVSTISFSASTSSTSYVNIGSTISFLAWNDSGSVASLSSGYAMNTTANNGMYIKVSIDGSIAAAVEGLMNSPVASQNQSIFSTSSTVPTDGLHTVGIQGKVSVGGSATAVLGLSVTLWG